MIEKKEEIAVPETLETSKTPKNKKPISERFRESWNKQDTYCSHCNAPMQRVTGINKQNIKRLFSFSTNPSDWIVLFMIIMVLFGAWAYNRDISTCREMVHQQQQSDPNGLNAFNLLPSAGPNLGLIGNITLENYSSQDAPDYSTWAAQK